MPKFRTWHVCHVNCDCCSYEHAWMRLVQSGKFRRCIYCGRQLGNMQLGHYRKVKAASEWEAIRMASRSSTLQKYAGFCPACGKKLVFAEPYCEETMESVSARCSSCGKKWSLIFDLDKSGTFGVVSFQCDNADRIIS